MSATAEAAREHARRSNGQFGTQHHSSPGSDLPGGTFQPRPVDLPELSERLSDLDGTRLVADRFNQRRMAWAGQMAPSADWAVLV